jgi:hypothetical protein
MKYIPKLLGWILLDLILLCIIMLEIDVPICEKLLSLLEW